jgi:hypothetical protein
MRFRFTATPTGGIRLIEEIADYKLGRLEGRNGIGKTLAVRLLELATGGQPYVGTSAAWQTLRDYLGEVQIIVDGLREGDALELLLTPDGWPDEQPRDLTSLGSAWLNGQPIDFRSVPDLLRVVRIGGDEDLITEFKQIIEMDARLVADQNTRLSLEIEHIGTTCDRLLRDTAGLSRQRLDELVGRQESALKHRAAAKEEYERQEETVSRLELLGRHIETLSELEEQGPSIEEDLGTIETTLKNLISDRDTLEEQRRRLLPDPQHHTEQLAQLQRLNRERERQAERAKESDAKAKDALVRLGLSANSDSAAIREEEKHAKSERSELSRSKALLRAPPDLIALIRQLRLPLDPVRETGLEEEQVATIEQLRVTVRELREGLMQREAELSDQQQHALMEEIETKFKVVDARLRELRAALRLVADARDKAADLQRIENEARIIATALATRPGEEYQQVVIALEHVQEKTLEQIDRRAELRYRLGVLKRAGSTDELEREITELRSDLEVKGSPTPALEDGRARLAVYRVNLQSADEEERLATINLREFERRVDERVGVLERRSEYGWLRSALGEWLPTTSDARLTAVDKMARLDSAIRRFQQGMDSLEISANRALDGLRQLAQYGDQTSEVENSDLMPLAEHYARRFGELLSDRNIQSTLFEGGKFSRLDLLRWEVTWESADGEPRRRPLEAFSSGERAFTYVLASILRHTGQSSRNRMLVLDEFGAFIEADRLDRLLRFLADQVLAPGRTDQVLIILPLHQTVGEAQGEEEDSQAQTIVDRGYFMKSIPVEAAR